MDPASAIGVAAAVVQFIDVSLKVLKIFKEIRDDEKSTTRSNKEFELSARTLEHYRSQLGSTTRSGRTDRHIIALAHDCARTAKELIDLLEYVRGGSKKVGKARITWRAILKRKPIDELQKLLEHREGVLNKLLIQDTNINVERLRQEIQQQSLSSTESILRLSKALQMETLKQLSVAKEGLHRRFDAAELETQRYRDTVSQLQDRERFLESLFFPEIDQRQSSIRGAHPGTFRWIYGSNESPQDISVEGEQSVTQRGDEDKAPSLIPRSKQSDGDSDSDAADSEREGPADGRKHPQWDSFSSWLRKEGAVYWISGKAGSGKSTLMAYIVEHERTKQELRTWSQGAKLLILSFFFWRAGSSLQQSVVGLLRSLLYQLCRTHPQIIPSLLSLMGCSATLLPTWTEDGLIQLIKAAISSAAEHRICIFIDGLDEFTGPYDELVDLMFELQAFDNVKCCVSSRPETELSHGLAGCHKLRLQDFNEQDVKTLVRDKLRPLGLARRDLRRLTWNVTYRSEGIFLWAALVTQSLVKGIKSGDELETLELRLDEMPQDLGKLFLQMVQKIDKVHRKSLAFYIQAARLVQLQQGSPHFSTIAHVAAARHLSQVSTYEGLAQRCKQVETQVVAQSAGLLEVVPLEPSFARFDEKRWEVASSVYMVPELRCPGKELNPGNFGRREMFRHPVPFPDVLRYEDRYISWIHRSAYDFLFPADGAPSPFDYGGLDLQRTLGQIGEGAANYVAVAPSYSSGEGTSRHIGASENRILDIIGGLSYFNREHSTTVSSILDALRQSVLALPPSEVDPMNFLTRLLDPDDGQPPTILTFWAHCILRHPEYMLSHLELMAADLGTTPILAAYLDYFTRVNLHSWLDILDVHGLVASLKHIIEVVLKRIGVHDISDGRYFHRRKVYINQQQLLGVGNADPVFVISCQLTRTLRNCEEKYDALVCLSLANAFMKWNAMISAFKGGSMALLEGGSYESFWSLDKLLTQTMEGLDYQFSILRSPSTAFDRKVPERYRDVAPRLVLLVSWEAWLALLASSANRTRTIPGDLPNGLTIACMPYQLKIRNSKGQQWQSLAEVERPVTFRPSPKTASCMLGLLYTSKRLAARYRLDGTSNELKALYDMIVADIWANEGKLSATEQLFALACVQTCFRHWWDWDDVETTLDFSVRPNKGGAWRRLFRAEENPSDMAEGTGRSESPDLGKS